MKMFKKKSKRLSPTSNIRDDDSSLSSSMSSLAAAAAMGGTPPRPRRLSTGTNGSVNSEKSLTRRRDLEVLGKTVGAVHEVLCSLNSENDNVGTAADGGECEGIVVTDVSFNPQGCIWTAWLQNASSGRSDDEENSSKSSGTKHPIIITCCTHESANKQSFYSIELSPQSDNTVGDILKNMMSILQKKLQTALDQVMLEDDISSKVCVKIRTFGPTKSEGGATVDNDQEMMSGNAQDVSATIHS